jgi:hypothetical protein
MRVRRLVDFPYVLVRLRCDACKRAGSYRLARLAVKYGADDQPPLSGPGGMLV